MANQDQIRYDNFYIGGKWIAPASSDRIDVIGANTGAIIGSVPDGAPADIDVAVAAARRAFDGGWSASTPAERAALIGKFADALERFQKAGL